MKFYNTNSLNMYEFNEKDCTEVIFTSSDFYIILDIDLITNDSKRSILMNVKDIGTKIVMIVYDLIPITHSYQYSDRFVKLFNNYLTNDIGSLANIVFTISNYTKNILEQYLNSNNLKTGLKIIPFPLGFDIPVSLSHKDVIPNQFLTIGTVEPRKGYDILIHAFELLHSLGYNYNLITAGSYDRTRNELSKNYASMVETSAANNNFHTHFENANDTLIAELYQTSSALIYPSIAEGFGLPIIEAVSYGLPLILRDIPVFREVAEDNAYYFPDTNNPEDLAYAIIQWGLLQTHKLIPDTSNIKLYSWHDSAKYFVEQLLLG